MLEIPLEPKCGTYRISHAENGKFYIGSSCEIDNRWKTHKRDLQNDKHCNNYLQSSWNISKAAAEVDKFKSDRLGECLDKGNASYKGFTWEYADE